ncbi:50S ribosomal protein L23 [Candidatus Saccharibacteria bacterium]|nr:50S ribosomal protein L23 [Candidatus Saccharibacteria bacterium]
MAAKTTKTSAKDVKKNLEKALGVTLIPRATEKTYAEQAKRTYAFFVPLDASKQAVKKLVEEQFSVSVTDVRVLTRKGKATRYSKGKHAYPGTTYRRDHKLAYVTLKDGDKIKVFEEEEVKETDKKADKKAEKEAKVSAKAAKKAEKKGNDK